MKRQFEILESKNLISEFKREECFKKTNKSSSLDDFHSIVDKEREMKSDLVK